MVYFMEGYTHADDMVRLHVALRGLRVSHATQTHSANLGDPPHSFDRRIGGKPDNERRKANVRGSLIAT